MEKRPINGIWGQYSVTQDGQVINERTGKIRVAHLDNKGYLCVTLPLDLGYRKAFKVHTLVYTAFIGDIPSGMEIDHINRDREDNRLENLRLVSSRDNSHNSEYMGTKRRGVYYNKQRKKWIASIFIERKHRYIGIFETEGEALEEYTKARENWGKNGIMPMERPKPDKDKKHCSGCDQILPREAFYYLPKYKRYSALCRDCTCRQMRERRKAERSAE